MYHVGPIGLTALVLYLISLFLSASGLISRQVHRRFWNWILLITFFLTATLGIFMALQVNYRWNLPFAKEALHLHVEFGVGMAFAALVHLTWHLRYYSGSDTRKTPAGDGEKPSTAVYAAVKPETGSSFPQILLLLTGLVSSSVQFIMLREALILGGGSETTAGVFLWLWLIISALGAGAGGNSGFTGLRRMMWAVAFAPVLSLLLFILMNTVIIKPGELPSVFKSVAIIAITVAPTAFVSSFVFIRLSYIRNMNKGPESGNSFGLETLGSVAAGILTTMAFLVYPGNFRLYILLIAFTLFLTVIIFYRSRLWRTLAWVCLTALILVTFIFKPDPIVRGLLLRGVKVNSSTDTPYGNIVTGTYGGETAVYYDHRPLFFSGDIAREEENIHYTLLQRDEYERVMIISGGLQKHLAQLSKYNIKEVIYIEHDPGIIAAENARDTLVGGMSVRVVKSDPVKFLKKNKETFDVIIQLIPPATTLSVNRFFTTEYFGSVKDHLNEGGIFTCTPAPYYNYSPESYRRSFSPVCNSLRSTFSNVTVVPGTLLYVMASDDSLTAEVASLVSKRGIETIYVSDDYLDDADIKARGDTILAIVDTEAAQNSVMRPVTSWFSNSLSLELRGAGGISKVIAVMSVILPFFFIRKKGFVMFAASAGLAGYGMIIVFMIQAAIGNLYILTALVLSLIMAGLATGAAASFLRLKTTLAVSPLILALLIILTGIFSARLTETAPLPLLLIVFPALLAAGFLTGNIYRELTTGKDYAFTGRAYASDLAGSALGYGVVSTLLVPLTGIMNASFILAFVILMAVALVPVLIKR